MTHFAAPDYFAPDRWEQEQKVLSDECWQLVGLTDQIPEDGCYVTTSLGGRSIFVQNFKGVIKAFVNCCPHRFAAIRTKAEGKDRVSCPYHGWTFDENGGAIGVPLAKEQFHCHPSHLSDRRLRPIETAMRGRFIFARNGNGERGLDDYLGAYGAVLDRLSASDVRMLAKVDMKVEANWKLLWNNTLDELHIVSVHPATFGGAGPVREGTYRYFYQSPHSAMSLNNAEGLAAEADLAAELTAGTLDFTSGYRIFNFFPNFLTSFLFKQYCIASVYIPVGPTTTTVRTFVFHMGPEADSRDHSRILSYFQGVLGEDHDLAANNQTVIKEMWTSPLYAKQEERLARWEQEMVGVLTRNGAVVG